MKQLFRILTLALFLGTLNSCEKYFETPSNSVFTEQSAFSNLDFATKVVYSIYDILISNDLYSYYYMYTKIDTDIEFSMTADEGAKFQLGHYNGGPGSARLAEMWVDWYKGIEYANICIDNLPKSPLWEGEYAAEARRLYAEAVVLRALFYYELIGTWGDVPFKVTSTQAGEDFSLPKTDRDEIYEYIIKDIRDVAEFLPWMSQTGTTERVSKGFAKGLRARIALAYSGYSLRNVSLETRRGRNWREYYEIARQECKELMESNQHSLNPSFENIFRTLHTYNMDLHYKEVLFELGFARLYSGPLAVRNGMSFNTSDPKYGRGGGDVRTSPHYYYSFDTKDKRRNVAASLVDQVLDNGISRQALIPNHGRNFRVAKWRKSWIVPAMGGDDMGVSNTGINFPMMRYSDVLLMYAEAECELNGPTESAQKALAQVRARAFDPSEHNEKVNAYIQKVSAGKASFFKAIVDERAWEFGGGELLRKFDLVRWNLLEERIENMKRESLKIMENHPDYAWVPNYVFWKYKEDGEMIEILNPDYRLPSTQIEGYTRANGLPLISASNKQSFINSINIVGHGYSAAKNNHLYPIATNILTASNGVLKNDQIP